MTRDHVSGKIQKSSVFDLIKKSLLKMVKKSPSKMI